MDDAHGVTVSLCMIVKNEEAVLARCLDAAQGVYDQLIIVDTGSTDATRAIAARYTNEVYSVPWRNDFGAARNESYAHAKCDYILYLDADDVLPPEERGKLLELRRSLAAYPEAERPRTIFMRYDVPEAGGISYRSRMVARRPDVYWYGPIHECLDCKEPTLDTDILILHRKLVQPPKERNCDIIRAIPEETLRKNFWLCAQCCLDMILAGHDAEADDYFALCQASYRGDAETCLQVADTLTHRKYWAYGLRWAALALEWPGESEAETRVALLQQAVKCCAGLGRMAEARAFNERVLEARPDNRAARLNRLFFQSAAENAP